MWARSLPPHRRHRAWRFAARAASPLSGRAPFPCALAPGVQRATSSSAQGGVALTSGCSPSSSSGPLALGIDFGTDSVRCMLVDLHGTVHGDVSSCSYAAGTISRWESGHGTGGGASPNTHRGLDVYRLPPRYCLQDADDWIAALHSASGRLLHGSGVDPSRVRSVGVSFTSSTVLPCDAAGVPLYKTPRFRDGHHPHAWPKLWKHHGAHAQAVAIQETAAARPADRAWLEDRYPGGIDSEWLHPKALEVFDEAPAVFEAAAVFVEAGDWVVWQLTTGGGGGGGSSDTSSGGSGPDIASTLTRSSCFAGYKACMVPSSADNPDAAFFDAVRPSFGTELSKRLPELRSTGGGESVIKAPGDCAGRLHPAAAAELLSGLALPGTPVSVAIIDAHAGVPGAGIGTSAAHEDETTLVAVLGTSGCFMLSTTRDAHVPGTLGKVRDGIFPGSFGYEMGQSSCGDAFAWLARVTGRDFAALSRADHSLRATRGGAGAAAHGPLALDWFNGCRSPYNDPGLTSCISGVTMETTPEDLYAAVLLGVVAGARTIAGNFVGAGLPVTRLRLTGGLPHAVPALPRMLADAVGVPVSVASGDRPGSLMGAAVTGAVAAGHFPTMDAAVAAIVRREGSGGRGAAAAGGGGGGGGHAVAGGGVAARQLAGVGGGEAGESLHEPHAAAKPFYDELQERYERLAAFELLQRQHQRRQQQQQCEARDAGKGG